ncbi:MAG: pyridoxal-phosphate dependent enzyme [Ferruginibacter sp.]
MLLPCANITTETLTDDLFDLKQVSISILRLDKIDPVVSGNKLFKLHYFLEEAIRTSAEGIVTFGGAYSNHLVATAFACKQAGLKSSAIVRGERPAALSHTLIECLNYGMQLKFISRQEYHNKEQPFFLETLHQQNKNYIIVPEGGYHPKGAAGAAIIMDLIDDEVSHICCAVGTATTIAGLLLSLKGSQQVIGVPVLKNMHDLQERITFLTKKQFSNDQLKIVSDYHFGGYAKKTPPLIDGMNMLYEKHRLPTDFVYTGKMMLAIMDCIKKDFFPKRSKVVCIHTGGLQGNLSLTSGALVF